MKACTGLTLGAVLLAAACGGGSSNLVAKVGSKPITKAQLQAALSTAGKQYRREHLPFPRSRSAEYLLLREQALDFLVQQTLAHQVDAKLGIKPEDRVVTNASFVKVESDVHISDTEVRAYFTQNRKRYQGGKARALDRGLAGEIRSELLHKRRGAVMHRFVAEAERRWPVTYAAGYAPVSEMALARRVWTQPPHRPCDLPAGTYAYARARAHGCLTDAGPTPGVGSPVCTLIDFPGAVNGFTSAEENDGFADYLTSNAGTCTPDPRLQTVQVLPRPNHTPVKVSYLHLAESATFDDPLLGLRLRYPRRLHVQRLQYGSLVTIEGVEIANYPLGPSTAGRPLSPGGIDFTFTQGGGGLPTGRGVQRDTKLPLRIPDSSSVGGTYTTSVRADGMTFGLTIRTGSSPSRQDLDAVRAIVASIHFPPLRIGHFTPQNDYVLGHASSYPLGSVTEIPADIPLPWSRPGHVKLSGRFYLEHLADGFWSIDWPGILVHGYKTCGPHYDAKHHQFTCPSGAVWDLKGRVVRNPHPARDQDDPLYRSQVNVADGYVLVYLPSPP